MRYYKRKFRRSPAEPTVRRYEGGREVCLANEAGRAEYARRKQLLWEDQAGLCDQCHLRMWLLETRMTGGAWGPTGQLRDDRLRDNGGASINRLVHKGCLAEWHRAHGSEQAARREQQAAAAAAQEHDDMGEADDTDEPGLDGFEDYETNSTQRVWVN